MQLEYFARWGWPQRRGLDPLTEKKATQLHEKGDTYVVHVVDERLVGTLRGETSYLALGFLGPASERLGGVALLLGEGRRIESIDVRQHEDQVVRLQGGHGPRLTVAEAPFDEPTEFDPRPPPGFDFPGFGRLEDVVRLPRDPWAYVVLPPGFEPPKPLP